MSVADCGTHGDLRVLVGSPAGRVGPGALWIETGGIVKAALRVRHDCRLQRVFRRECFFLPYFCNGKSVLQFPCGTFPRQRGSVVRSAISETAMIIKAALKSSCHPSPEVIGRERTYSPALCNSLRCLHCVHSSNTWTVCFRRTLGGWGVAVIFTHRTPPLPLKKKTEESSRGKLNVFLFSASVAYNYYFSANCNLG